MLVVLHCEDIVLFPFYFCRRFGVVLKQPHLYTRNYRSFTKKDLKYWKSRTVVMLTFVSLVHWISFQTRVFRWYISSPVRLEVPSSWTAPRAMYSWRLFDITSKYTKQCLVGLELLVFHSSLQAPTCSFNRLLMAVLSDLVNSMLKVCFLLYVLLLLFIVYITNVFSCEYHLYYHHKLILSHKYNNIHTTNSSRVRPLCSTVECVWNGACRQEESRHFRLGHFLH